jgi:shikimate dehydrogenase
VVAGLVAWGVTRIGVAGRQAEAREGLVASCQAWASGLEAVAWDRLEHWLPEADLVVNTTPVGMASAGDPEAIQASPLEVEALARLRPGATVYDLIYTPRPTALLRQAADRGCRCLDGLEMLVQQGAAALRLWSGEEAIPVEAMRQAARAALGEA